MLKSPSHQLNQENKILNLSSHKLSQDEISILEKGLKFTPTPTKPHLNEIKTDISVFTRRIQLAEFFHNTENTDDSLVRNNSKWTPPLGRSMALDSFIKNVTGIPLANTPQTTQSCKSNINIKQRHAINDLINNKNIIIKEADKGGAVVIMNTTHYKQMSDNILNDISYYKPLDKDPQKTERIQYNRLLNKHKTCLREKEFKYLKEFETKHSQFYGLPKVHKSKTIQEQCQQTPDICINIKNVHDLNLRPIIAGPECLTSRLSNLIDIILKPLVHHVPSYLRDTTDFLKHLPTNVKDHTILASFDVESLYSNICNDLGLTAIKHWVDTKRSDIPDRFTTDFILESLKFIIENNSFQFNNVFYLQVKGTAMGTKVAPTYATLTIGFLEIKLYSEISHRFGTQFSNEFIEVWKRFLDDCFITWNKSQSDLIILHDILNTLHPDIKFTLESSNIKLPFLDCLVKKTGNKLTTDIYYKPTDSKSYLLFNSCHPRHTKTSIPFSLFRRLKTIISEQHTFDQRAQELISLLKRQKYPETLIYAGLQKARSLDRESLLLTEQIEQPKIIPYVSTYNPRNPEIYSQIINDINILKRDTHMNDVLNNYSFIKSKRQPKNLKRLLTRAKFGQNENTPTITICERPNCGLCSYLLTGDSYTTKSGKTLKVKTAMNCEVKNVVYVMICSGCGEEYVGETNDLRKRTTVHRQHIRDESVRKLKVSGHMEKCTNKNNETMFKIYPAIKMNSDGIAERRLKEKQLINLIKPKLN